MKYNNLYSAHILFNAFMVLTRVIPLICGALFFSHTAIGQRTETVNAEPFVIGETFTINSLLLNESRTINVYLPFGYDPDSLPRYPVIYLLDGAAEEDFIHIAGLVQFGSFSWINMLPESIVVGIANTDRKRDFTFQANNKNYLKNSPTSGGSTHFIQFISDELQPLIDLKYKTQKPRTLIGQSLGGLLATEILFNHPQMFDNYIIVSPSLWWDNEALLSVAPGQGIQGKKIAIEVGKEGKIMESEAKRLFKNLQKTNLPNTKVYFNYLESQDHGNVLHLALYDAFEKIFAREKP